MDQLRRIEPLLRMAFRLIVIALLVACYIELRSLKSYIPEARDFGGSDLSQVQRDVQAIRESMGIKRPSDPGEFHLRPR